MTTTQANVLLPALLNLLMQWGSSSNRSSLEVITHDGADDGLYGGTGDDDFCWESADLPALNSADFNATNMGADERFRRHVNTFHRWRRRSTASLMPRRGTNKQMLWN